MKRIHSLFVLGLMPLGWAPPAFAQAQPAIGLTPVQIQRLSRDLVPSSSQDFFNQGQRRLEAEVKLLNQQRFLKGDLLKVSPTQTIPQDFSQFERPDRSRRKADQ